MGRSFIIYLTKISLSVATLLSLSTANAQGDGDFWDHVRFGGGAGAAFGNGYTDVTLAPGAIYQFNQYVAAGVGIQGSYVRRKEIYESYMYGGSIMTLFNPIPEIQLSAEMEQLRVNLQYEKGYSDFYEIPRQDNFWNTALFVGAGYNTGNVIIGVRYNILFREEDRVYSDAFMPFIRVYF